jgi:hypothetical protein
VVLFNPAPAPQAGVTAGDTAGGAVCVGFDSAVRGAPPRSPGGYDGSIDGKALPTAERAVQERLLKLRAAPDRGDVSIDLAASFEVCPYAWSDCSGMLRLPAASAAPKQRL